jgi:hypothetical protein
MPIQAHLFVLDAILVNQVHMSFGQRLSSSTPQKNDRWQPGNNEDMKW